ncbi:hypothetical protein Ddc_21366 [Ditylenchus destructor]|nr:hypothetical protein Ddc_21366 [Ditylenchus destructor]
MRKVEEANRISKIAALDNDTMVEVFKHLNYMQLAKSSLVSKKFSNLIRTHRHSLASLYVDTVRMDEHGKSIGTWIWNKQLSPKKYNQWLIRNYYLQQIPMEGQIAEYHNNQHGCQEYDMGAYYKNPRQCDSDARTIVFSAHKELSDENWPLFQHFGLLLTAPSIYIDHLQLTAGIDTSFLNLLAGAMDRDYNRVQCTLLEVWNTNPEGNMPKFIKWIKDHVRCCRFHIAGRTNLNYEEELLDYFTTGANSTSEIYVDYHDLGEVVIAFVKKIMDLKSCDECQLVEFISGHVSKASVQKLKRIHANFIGKENQNDNEDSTEQIFEFVNADIGKKVQLTITNPSKFSLKITNL